MDQILLIIFMLISFPIARLYAQQNYSGNSITKCDNKDDTGPSPAFLYTCNGRKLSCKAFMIFKAQTPYGTVFNISNLTSSDPAELARINNITNFSEVLQPGQEVIVPVNCSCSGQYYQANTSFIIPTIHDTYLSIAYNMYEGLTTCDILKRDNNYSGLSLDRGLRLKIPLRCACPTSDQTRNGTKFLLTYLVSWGDYVYDISKRFNASMGSVFYANGFTENDPVIYPNTTILVPLSTEPSSNQTKIHYPPPPYLPPSIPIVKFNNQSSKQFHVWTGIGISLLLMLFFVVCVMLLHNKQKRVAAQSIRKGKLTEEILLSIANIDQGLKFYKYEDLNMASDSFSSRNKIGDSVYFGTLDGERVAIKKMSKNVQKEVKLLKKINHFNLISLNGACEHEGVFHLVYEFMENGSLKDWLHKSNDPEVESWNCRIQIALDVAHGLLYLHNFTEPAYVHKDICSDNVLLDKDLRAKIANFSLARSAVREESGSVSMKTALGTKGYVAPEYIEYGLVTPEMDTYAFGVVLLELVTRKEAVYVQDGEEVLLAEVLSTVDGPEFEAKLGCLIEPHLQAKTIMGIVKSLAKLSVTCMSEEPESRPSMEDVVSSLLKIQMDVRRLEPFFWTGAV